MDYTLVVGIIFTILSVVANIVAMLVGSAEKEFENWVRIVLVVGGFCSLMITGAYAYVLLYRILSC